MIKLPVNILAVFAIISFSSISLASKKVLLSGANKPTLTLQVETPLHSEAKNLIYERNVLTGENKKGVLSPFVGKENIPLDFLSKIESDVLLIDLKLSDTEVLGFSENARLAYIKKTMIDPIDLGIDNKSNSLTTPRIRDWVSWRKIEMKNLIISLAKDYKARNPQGKMFILGKADYYGQQEFNDLRSVQDWLAWAQTGEIDGVLLQGRWLSRYGDADRFEYYAREWNNLMKPAGRPVMLIPVSGGSKRVPESNYARDWQILKAKVPKLIQMGIMVEDEADRKQADLFLAGKSIPVATKIPQVGQLMPEFEFPGKDGSSFGPQNWVSKSAVNLLLLPSGLKSKTLVGALQTAAPNLKAKGIEAVVIAPARLDYETPLPVLLDKGREILDIVGKQPVLVQIDKAGWVRSWQVVPTSESVSKALEQNFEVADLKVGQMAPDFAISDLNGEMRRLSDLKGKKNLLLTFFPKCFTGGCKNHLVSINERLADFDAAQTEAWAVSIDPADVQRDFSAMWSFKFPLLPDVGRNLSLLYGAAQNTEQLAARMSVLIDKTGKVVWIDKGVNVASHGADVLAKIAELELSKTQ